MTNEEMILAFRRLNEEVEDLRKLISEKDKIISKQNLTIMSIRQELTQKTQKSLESIEEQTSEASKSFL